MLLTIGVRLENKVVGLAFAEPSSRLQVVTKLVRTKEAEHRLAREADTLTALASLPPSGIEGVPRLLFSEHTATGLAVCETALDGARLFTWVRADNAGVLAQKVADWALKLVRTDTLIPPDEWWMRVVEPIVRDFSALYGCVINDELLRDCISRLRGLGPLPSTVEHRDFGWWNVVLTTNDELAVLDWETAEVHGLPGLDLIYFLYFIAALLDGSSRDSGFRETLRRMRDARTLTGRIHAETVDRYWRGAGLDPSSVLPLRLLTWMLQAISDFRDITDRCGGPPGPDALRNGLYFALWEEDLRYARDS
jgi:hypothetical protein